MTQQRMRSYRPVRCATVYSAILVTVFLSACGHYRVGLGDEPPYRTIELAVTDNAFAPQLDEWFRRSLHSVVMTDERVSLVNGGGDAVLEVELTGLHRRTTAVDETDAILARKYNYTLAARYSLRDNRNGRTYVFDRSVQVSRQAFLDDGAQAAEAQTIPILTQELANLIAHQILDVW